MPKESFIPDQHMDIWSSLSLVGEFQSFSNGHCLLHNGLSFSAKGKVDRKKKMNRHEKKDYNFVQGIREHVRLGPKISETVKGKLSLGARILQLGGVKRVFKQIFGVREGEKLLKASQCYLSTTAGPLAGLLFISTQRVAFCSERSIKFSSPNGELVRFHYKVG
ncbi:hypothetical protein VitviT2T_016122 [Vitis vinifera]|uniref:GRAM domain-containing protein n=1 Tax=Vitis vinifera TaxID=29760 RepID=A0ABY9CSQ7_VITVI|nr:hypothetical protein VitviT2T_016122 [Vitis vinifera]